MLCRNVECSCYKKFGLQHAHLLWVNEVSEKRYLAEYLHLGCCAVIGQEKIDVQYVVPSSKWWWPLFLAMIHAAQFEHLIPIHRVKTWVGEGRVFSPSRGLV